MKMVLGADMLMLLILALVGPGFCQVDCPPFTADLLGSTTAASTTGLVRDAFAAITGETSPSAITVQVHASNIVCLTSGRTRNMYSGVSVVVNYTCNGASNPACNGNPTNSQFDFECVSGPIRWAASVDGSADNIVTTPPTGNFATTLRRDCGVCISPARFPFGTITNNEQHCGSCDPACNNGLSICFSRVSSGCCSFYERDSCVASCTPPLVSNSNFDCVHDCPVLTITNGMVSYQPPGTPPVVGATASYTCNTGYTRSGSNMRTCQEVSNGTWTGSDPFCNPVDCGGLPNPANGQVTASTTTFGSNAMYRCNNGYTLSGSATRNCLADATWSGTEPTCSPVDCGGLPSPANGQVATSVTTLGSTATYSCNNGYTLSGSAMRNCMADATWSGTEPTCSPVDCGSLPSPANGQVDTSTTTLGSTAVYRCNNGYTVSGSAMRNCLADATWSDTEPTCSPVDCGGLPSPANGQVDTGTTTFGSTATYSCNNGYTVSGSATRNCLADATWSGTKPTCSPVDCGTLSRPPNGRVEVTTTTFGSAAHYGCDQGYALSGSAMRNCQANGTWSGTEPTCAVDCGTLSRPPNGRVDVTTTTFGSAALYGCDQGYALSGSAMRNCQADGTWSGTEPTCVSCSSQIANCTQCRVNTAPRLSLTCETCLPRYNLQGNECKLPCEVRFCKTCGDDSSKCMECNVGYEVDASKRCIVGGDDGGGGLDRAGLIGVILGAIIAFIILLAIVLGIIVGVYRLKEPKPPPKRASRIVYPGEFTAFGHVMQNPFYMGTKQAEKLAQQGKEGVEEEEREEGEEEVGEKEEAGEKEETVGSEHSLEQINAEENP